MKVNPITQRAKSSPYKASAVLIQGAADIAPKFVDYGADMPKGEKRKVEKQSPPDPETTTTTTPEVE